MCLSLALTKSSTTAGFARLWQGVQRQELHHSSPEFLSHPATNSLRGGKENSGIQRRTNHNQGYGGQLEKGTLVIRATHDIGDSVRFVGPASRLFPDQPGPQYCRRSQYNRSSTSQSLGNLVYSWVGLLDRHWLPVSPPAF